MTGSVTDSMEFFLNRAKLSLNSVAQFEDPVCYLCLVGCAVLMILICAHNLYLKMKRTKYLAKPLKLCSDVVEANAKIFFDVCRLFFDLFYLFFDIFRFHSQFHLV